MAESLRDQLAASFDKVTTGGGDDAPIEPAITDTTAPSKPAPSAAQPPSSRIVEAPKHDAATDKARDPKTGKFVEEPKPAAQVAIPSAAKVHKAPTAEPGSPQAQAALPENAAAAPIKQRPQRPSSWKKEYWDHWEKLDPDLAQYLHTRESQFASGVSAYKAEAEQAKPIMEAMQPFMAELQQHNIEPTRWISELGHVHRILALGNPAQKLQTLANVARSYGVPLQALYDQQAQQQYLQQGQFQQPLQPPQAPQQRMLTAADAEALFQQKFMEVDSNREIQRFEADAEKHPHYVEVRNTMAQLLEANLADDLESAYQAALKHPRHEALLQQVQEQERAAQEEARRAAEAQRVQKARAKAVSSQSSTPTAPNADDKPKGLRSNIEAAFEAHAGGRV